MVFYADSNFNMDNSLGYLVRRLHQLGAADLDPIFVDEGMTATQWSALVAIWLKQGVTCAEVAREISYDKGAMTRLVDTLEQRGWVVRERDTADRRAIKLELTPEGIAIAKRCKMRVVERWNERLVDWDGGDVTALIAQLHKLLASVEATIAKGPVT